MQVNSTKKSHKSCTDYRVIIDHKMHTPKPNEAGPIVVRFSCTPLSLLPHAW